MVTVVVERTSYLHERETRKGRLVVQQKKYSYIAIIRHKKLFVDTLPVGLGASYPPVHRRTLARGVGACVCVGGQVLMPPVKRSLLT